MKNGGSWFCEETQEIYNPGLSRLFSPMTATFDDDDDDDDDNDDISISLMYPSVVKNRAPYFLQWEE